MKVGDTVPVNIGSHVVAQATVKELGDGTATLVVPATLVVMGTRTELSDLPASEPSTEVVIDGVDRASASPENTTVDTNLEGVEPAVEVSPDVQNDTPAPPVNNDEPPTPETNESVSDAS